MKFSELQDKQVVNVQDGTLIGRVEDLDLSLIHISRRWPRSCSTAWLTS